MAREDHRCGAVLSASDRPAPPRPAPPPGPTAGLVPCTAGSAADTAGTLLNGGRRLRAVDGSPVHHHLGVSAFATHAVVDRRSVVAVEDDVPVVGVGGRTVTAGLPAPQARASVSPLALVSGARTLVGSHLGSSVPGRAGRGAAGGEWRVAGRR